MKIKKHQQLPVNSGDDKPKKYIANWGLCLRNFIIVGYLTGFSSLALAQNGFGVETNNADPPVPAAPAPVAVPTNINAGNNMGAVNNPNNAVLVPTVENPAFGDSIVGQEAFSNTLRSLMPLTPGQIKTLRYLFDQSQRAAATEPADFPPKPTSSSVIVNLSPGSTPPVIRLRAGYVTSLVFLDSTGEPWPITAFDLGNPKSFNIQWDKKGNTLMVQAIDSYQTGNLAVMLQDQNTPVMLTLLPGQREVDYRVDLRIPGLGPNALPEVSTLPEAANAALMDFLNGVPPENSQVLEISGGTCQGWLLGNHMYLRTPLTVLSPSWLASVSSPDGTHVYEMIKAPVVLASSRGKIVELKVEGL